MYWATSPNKDICITLFVILRHLKAISIFLKRTAKKLGLLHSHSYYILNKTINDINYIRQDANKFCCILLDLMLLSK